MPSAAFLRKQRPRRYDYLIEELVAAGNVVTVSDVTAQLDRRKRRMLRAWTCPMHRLQLVAAQAGAAKRWWFRCPACDRRCEAVYKVPGDEWGCRICCGGGLQYAARRHGRRHPTRRILTPRQEIIARRTFEREQRLVNVLAAVDPWWAARRDRLLAGMAQTVAGNDAEAARAAAWLREQPRRPRVTAPLKQTARGVGPDVLAVLRLLNTSAGASPTTFGT